MVNKKIMGILNLTPDSFYDGFCDKTITSSILKKKLCSLSSCDIIDVGCESSRPGAVPVSLKVEKLRLSKIIPMIKKNNKITFSIDTYKYKIADYALKNGFKIINDIYAGRFDNNKMFDVAANHSCPIVLMHMIGNPKDMQKKIAYKSLIDEIMFFFEERILTAKKHGISDDKIILDPGIGFGKKIEDNFKILSNIGKIKSLGYKVLIGLSRKKFLSFENDSPKQRLSSTISMNQIALQNGADIIRVHDPLDNLKMINVLKQYSNC